VSDTEKSLAGIWCNAVNIDGIGIHDNFFDLGGHSLAAIRILSQIIKHFRVEITLRSLFDSPTIAELAAVVDSKTIEELNSEKLNRLLSELEAMSEEDAQDLLTKKRNG
jgi:acyl carrier protein